MEISRVQTYIEGFDEALGGGIPKGHVILLTGLPGTMKTSLAYSVLFQNAAHDSLRSLYVTLEQKRSSIEMQMQSMGFAQEGPAKMIEIFDIARIQKEAGELEGERFWLDYIKNCLNLKRNISTFKLLVLDSLDALEAMSQLQDKRSHLFHLFEWLRDFNVTSFLITESPPEPGASIFLTEGTTDAASYLADGIIHLKMHQVNDIDIQRRIRCVKMRGSRHDTSFYALVFERGVFSITRPMST